MRLPIARADPSCNQVEAAARVANVAVAVYHGLAHDVDEIGEMVHDYEKCKCGECHEWFAPKLSSVNIGFKVMTSWETLELKCRAFLWALDHRDDWQ